VIEAFLSEKARKAAKAGGINPMRSGSDISNVLIVETSEDGTVGGSHRLLRDFVKRPDRTRLRPFVLFHQTNVYADLLSKSGVPVYCWDDFRRREQVPANPVKRVRRLFAASGGA
jgi:hypothetical protein